MEAAAAAAGDKPQAKKTFLGMDATVWKKIVPLGLMFFCILFNYTILRDTKVHRIEDVDIHMWRFASMRDVTLSGVDTPCKLINNNNEKQQQQQQMCTEYNTSGVGNTHLGW